MSVGQHYQGDAGRRYFAWQQSVSSAGAALNAQKFTRYVSAGDTLIDFGCGAGFLLEALEAREKLGVEPNEAAREIIVSRGLRVVGSTTEIEDAYADVVVSNHALEHTLSPLDELQGLLRILKPRGKLVLRLPLDDWRTQRKYDPTDINHHLFAWTPLLLGNLLSDAGFEVQNVRTVTRAWPPHLQAFLRLPPNVFEAVSWSFSVIARRRELAALAIKPNA